MQAKQRNIHIKVPEDTQFHEYDRWSQKTSYCYFLSELQLSKQWEQCDQNFCEKSAQFCKNIAQKGGLLNENFCQKKLLVKIWEYKDKK
jgi:hypothetical protein